MIVTFYPPVGSTKLAIEIYIDPDWFLNTKPAFVNIEQYIPEWEDKNDVIAFMYFLEWHFGPDVIAANSDILCWDAKDALSILNEDREW